jgi:hypothetical protein
MPTYIFTNGTITVQHGGFSPPKPSRYREAGSGVLIMPTIHLKKTQVKRLENEKGSRK